jgi:uncharacterized membrane protein YhiD involved in acid resistance
MNDFNSLNSSFNTLKNIDIQVFFFDLLYVLVLSCILAIIYTKFSSTIGNRQKFSYNFIFMSLATMLVISIVKNSLALSLGLVGALSIVRFRTPIKEPEDLVFLFISIAIGLGFGAEQREVTIISSLFIFLTLIIKYFLFRKESNQLTNMHIVANGVTNDDVENALNLIKKNIKFSTIKRIDFSIDNFEVLLSIEANKSEDILTVSKQLSSINKNFKVSYFEERGITV